MPTDTAEPSAALSPEDTVKQIAEEALASRFEIRTTGIDTADGANTAFVNYNIDPSTNKQDAIEQSLEAIRTIVPRVFKSTNVATIEMRSFFGKGTNGQRVLGLVMNVTISRATAEKTKWDDVDMRTLDAVLQAEGTPNAFAVGDDDAWDAYKNAP